MNHIKEVDRSSFMILSPGTGESNHLKECHGKVFFGFGFSFLLLRCQHDLPVNLSEHQIHSTLEKR